MMEISALSSSLSAQTMMGSLVVKVLDQTQQMIQTNMASMTDPIAQLSQELSAAIDGVGGNIDITA